MVDSVSSKRDPGDLSLVARTILDAVDGSTRLLERTKRLGKILSDQQVALRPVKIKDSIEGAFELVRGANAARKINHSFRVEEEELRGVSVLADELLDEVFANLFTNAVKYTDSPEVRIETVVAIDQQDPTILKISITDYGRGIPDERKERVFKRYLESSKGSGLGLSIVHALIVDRYNGKVEVKNRVPEDYTKGTSLVLRLAKTQPGTNA